MAGGDAGERLTTTRRHQGGEHRQVRGEERRGKEGRGGEGKGGDRRGGERPIRHHLPEGRSDAAGDFKQG